MRGLILTATLACLASAGEGAPTGPETEKRFPPLKVPPGFKATLFACDPLIEYPSVLALGPRSNSIFLAHDYMTGLGEKIVRLDEIHLVEDTDADGYADKSTVWASGFNSIQGLAYDGGRVFVMHAPFLTVLRDTNGDGMPDERRDILTGLGWPPEKAPDRLHGANGVVPGHDGWLYLALGDRGCDVLRPEGDRLVLNGGGILRCRPDGADLHVFATGLRNIYDIALDDDLNVFLRDNENDGGNYLIRVCHSFMGADHGYPYLYQEHPNEALPPLADLGRGSSAGGVAYREAAFPSIYHGSLFFCEWGRSVVMYQREFKGSGFAPMKETEFATGAPDDPYGFRPTDIIVDRDGSLLVSDWADGQRPKRGRGRVYRIEHQGEKHLPSPGLNSESYLARVEAQRGLEQRGRDGIADLKKQFPQLETPARLHAIWVFARAGDDKTLFEIAERRGLDTRVRVQAVRALADLFDPILIEHRINAGRGDREIAARLAGLGSDQNPRIVFEVTIALGRLRWSEAPDWLRRNIGTSDPPLAHAALQTLRRSRNWPSVLELLDAATGSVLRPIALGAIAEQADVEVVEGLIQRLAAEQDSRRRGEYAGLLARVHRKPGPWVYWGFRPEQRPPNTETWMKSSAIETTLNQLLADRDRELRRLTLERMQREKVPIQFEALIQWLRDEQQSENVAAILSALADAPAETVRDALEFVVRQPAHTITNRLAALEILVRKLDSVPDGRLLEIARSLEESVVLTETLRQIGRNHTLNSAGLLLEKVRSAIPAVRVAAIEALAALGANPQAVAAKDWAKIKTMLLELLNDPAASVRQASAAALGKLRLPEAADALIPHLEESDPTVRRQSLEALTALRELRALGPALRALEREEDEVLAALKYLAEMGGPAQAEAVTEVALRSRSGEILEWAARALLRWDRRADLARIEGATGVTLGWRVSGQLTKQEAARTIPSIIQASVPIPAGWPLAGATNSDARANFGAASDDRLRIGVCEFVVSEGGPAEFRASSSGTFEVWLNGKEVYHRTTPGRYAPDSDRFAAELQPGLNRLVAQISTSGSAEMHARFRRKSALERHEHLSQLALGTRGNPSRGREVFFNMERTGCIKCHRFGQEGGRVGPDLTGVGRRFSRIHLIESILEPSRAIAPAFRNLSVRLKDGRELIGVRIAETASELTLGDAQGQSHICKKDQVEELRSLDVSIMPEGLENGLTDSEFVDLIAFLAEQK